MKASLLPLLVVAMALSGCSALHIMGEYGGTPGQEVRLSCRRTYRVHEKADTLLVVAFSASEAAGAACLALQTGDEPEPAERSVRYWEAAEVYLARKTNHRCTISVGQELELLHSEFTFGCVPK